MHKNCATSAQYICYLHSLLWEFYFFFSSASACRPSDMLTCQREWGRQQQQQQNRQKRCNGLVLLQYAQACDKWWVSIRRLTYLAQHILMRFYRLCPVLSFDWNSSCQCIWKSFRVLCTNWQSYDGISHYTYDRNRVLLCDTESFVFLRAKTKCQLCVVHFANPIQCKNANELREKGEYSCRVRDWPFNGFFISHFWLR